MSGHEPESRRAARSWLLAPALAALASLGPACRAPVDPGPLRIAHETDVLSLDPEAVSEAATHSILSNVFESLAGFDKDMRLVPALAVGWSTPDETTWLVRLRQGVRFHDGSLLVADDVKAALERARDDAGSGVRGQLWSLKTVAVVDDSTLKLTTLRPDPLLMSRLTYILIAHRPPPGGPVAPIGTGPYRFIRWEKGRALEVAAFDGYWGGPPRVRRVLFVPVEQGETSVEALGSRRVDVLRDPPDAVVSGARPPSGYRLVARSGLTSEYLWFDSSQPVGSTRNPFADARVRRAVSLAIERPRLVRGARPRGVPAHQLIQAGVFGRVEGLDGLPYDPDQARKLIRDAGYGGGFEVTLVHSSGASAEATAGEVAAALGKVGIRLQLELLEWPELVSRWKAGHVRFFLSGWRFENGDATSFLRDCLHTRDPGRGYGSFNPGFSDARLDRLIDENDQVFGEGERLKHYEKIMRFVLQEMPLVPLDHRVNFYAVADRVRWEPRLDGKLLAVEMSVRP